MSVTGVPDGTCPKFPNSYRITRSFGSFDGRIEMVTSSLNGPMRSGQNTRLLGATLNIPHYGTQRLSTRQVRRTHGQHGPAGPTSGARSRSRLAIERRVCPIGAIGIGSARLRVQLWARIRCLL